MFVPRCFIKWTNVCLAACQPFRRVCGPALWAYHKGQAQWGGYCLDPLACLRNQAGGVETGQLVCQDPHCTSCVKFCMPVRLNDEYVYESRMPTGDCYHQMCSSNRSPTLHQVIPVLETLCSRWERRLEDPEFDIFHDTIRLGLEKLNKYYKRLDNTDAYILAMHLLFHSYSLRKC